MILKMLNEGKITLEEADELLAALELTGEELNIEAEKPAETKGEKTIKQKHEFKDSPTDNALNDEYDLLHEEYETLHEEFEELHDEFETLQEEIEVMEEELEAELEEEYEEMIEEIMEQEEEIDDHLDELDDELDELFDNEMLDESVVAEKKRRIKEKQIRLKEKAQKLKEQRQKLKEQFKEQKTNVKNTNKGISFDIQEGIDEIKKGFGELRKNFQGEGMQEFKSTMKDLAGQINDGMKDLREGFDEGTREVRKAFKGKDFKKMFGNIFKSFGIHSSITLEEELSGTFDQSQGNLNIDISTFNGRIAVIGTDESDYRLQLKYNIHAANEAEAQKLKKDMCIITQEPTLLKIETPKKLFGGVGVTLYIPKNIDADCKLKTSNGRITIKGLKNSSKLNLTSSNGRLELSDLRVDEVNGNTSNGRIEIKDFVSDVVNVHTSNGSIYLDGLCDQIAGRSSNGTITVYPHVIKKGNIDLSTSNGRIKVVVDNEKVGVDMDASTTMGGITFDFPDIEYQKKIEKHVARKYQAQTKDYIVSAKRLQIRANTSMGSIYIGQSKD